MYFWGLGIYVVQRKEKPERDFTPGVKSTAVDATGFLSR